MQEVKNFPKLSIFRRKFPLLDNLPNWEILNNMPFTFVNHDLRKILSDKVTPKLLIIKIFRCHLSLVTFAFTTDFASPR